MRPLSRGWLGQPVPAPCHERPADTEPRAHDGTACTSAAAASSRSSIARCRCIAAVALPVVPEVYSQKAGESAEVGKTFLAERTGHHAVQHVHRKTPG
jgi:hypothetical protein